MGCIFSDNVVQIIPQPSGQAKDPLDAEGDIIKNIMMDPHIHFYQKKLEEVILPFKKNNKKIGRVQRFATADKQQHKRYVSSLNQALQGYQSSSVTSILASMIQQIADIRQKTDIKQRFKDDAYAALKCFIYLYTGKYSYKKINRQLRSDDYQKICKVIAVVQTQLNKYNQQKNTRKLKANIIHGRILNLYRGINKPDKLMIRNQKLFWKAFTSTSLSTNVAEKFGKFTYVITLDTLKPHPFLIVPQDMSPYREEEILLFPYFYFECTGVKSFDNGAQYQCEQKIP